jgi:hypothetical protein
MFTSNYAKKNYTEQSVRAIDYTYFMYNLMEVIKMAEPSSTDAQKIIKYASVISKDGDEELGVLFKENNVKLLITFMFDPNAPTNVTPEFDYGGTGGGIVHRTYRIYLTIPSKMDETYNEMDILSEITDIWIDNLVRNTQRSVFIEFENKKFQYSPLQSRLTDNPAIVPEYGSNNVNYITSTFEIMLPISKVY